MAEVVELQRKEKGLVCRGKRKKDGMGVLVKSLPTRSSSEADAAYLRREYEVFINSFCLLLQSFFPIFVHIQVKF